MITRASAPLLLVVFGCGSPSAAREPEPPAGNQIVGMDASCPDAEACTTLGESMLEAKATPGRALELFRLACGEDHARGCERAAEMLLDYRFFHVPPDDDATAVFYDRACRLGNAHACYRYGFYLWEGMIPTIVVDGQARPYQWSEHRYLGLDLVDLACEMNEAKACALLEQMQAEE